METINTDKTTEVLADVLRERFRQDAKWGEQNHSPMYWLGILAEEFGEVAMDVNKYTFETDSLVRERKLHEMTTELIQVAAVCVAMVESIKRNELAKKEKV